MATRNWNKNNKGKPSRKRASLNSARRRSVHINHAESFGMNESPGGNGSLASAMLPIMPRIPRQKSK